MLRDSGGRPAGTPVRLLPNRCNDGGFLYFALLHNEGTRRAVAVAPQASISVSIEEIVLAFEGAEIHDRPPISSAFRAGLSASGDR